MFHFKNRKTEIQAPFSGELVNVTEILDPVFSQMMMGDGIGILPEEKDAAAPMEGTIVFVAETKHAVCIKNDRGIELMVHCGIDTVKYGGDGFCMYVKAGDRVKPGDKLFSFDKAFFEERGVDLTSPVLIVNSAQHPIREKAPKGRVQRGDMIYIVS